MRKLLFLLGAMFLFIGTIHAQRRVITGTSSEQEDSYSRKIPISAKILVFSSVGMPRLK